MAFEFKVDGNFANDVMAGLSSAIVVSLVTTMGVTAWENIKSEFNWGNDHKLRQETSVDGTMITDNITILAPRIRNNPNRNDTFANETMPNFFERINSGLVVDFANNVSNNVRQFLGKFL